MALVNCRECGKEISDKASMCPNCGYTYLPAYPNYNQNQMLTQNNKYTHRLVFGIISVSLSALVILLCITENIAENFYLFGGAIYTLIPGVIILFGKKSKPATITAAAFYFYSFIGCLALSVYHPNTLILGFLSLGFGIPSLVSGIKQKSKNTI